MSKNQASAPRGIAYFLWWLVYQALVSLVFAVTVPILPLLRRLRPETAAWLRARLLPAPLAFQPALWLHAVSLGEAKLVVALLKDLPAAARERCLVTATTRAGFEYFANHLTPQQLYFLPWDLAWCYRRLLGGTRRPDLVLVETEVWPNLFLSTKQAGARLMIVNGRLGPKTMRYRRNPLLRHVFAQLDAVAARGNLDVERFTAFGVAADRIVVTGNMKFDLKAGALPEQGVFRRWLQGDGPLFVFASISTDEVPLLAPQATALLAAFPAARLLWAPRHLDDLAEHETALAATDAIRRSALDAADLTRRVLILDTFGELAACYADASLSLIGGSFNRRGGQNFLESLQVGTPALMGPSTENFRREVEEARAAGAIAIIERADDVATILGDLMRDPARLRLMSAKAGEFLTKHQGAVVRTRAFLRDQCSDENGPFAT